MPNHDLHNKVKICGKQRFYLQSKLFL
jgi:hypothetical protein